MNKPLHPEPRPRTVSIGGATYDLFLTMGKALGERGGSVTLKAGGKLPVERVTESCGGGACNTSVGLQRLGCTAAFSGIIGSDQWGERLLKNLMKEGVDVSPATVVENETSSFSIILTLGSGDRTILYSPGVNEHLNDVTFDLDWLQEVDAVFLNHLSETSCVIEDDIVRTLLQKPERWLSWNPGGPQIRRGIDSENEAALLRMTNLLLLNKEEALAFTKAKDTEMALHVLVSAGAGNVCITDGRHGTVAADRKHTYRCPALPIPVVETTGAGDAFGTGALWALLKGCSLQEALVAGTLNSASVIGAIGAQAGLLTETQMRERMDQHLLTVETLP